MKILQKIKSLLDKAIEKGIKKLCQPPDIEKLTMFDHILKIPRGKTTAGVDVTFFDTWSWDGAFVYITETQKEKEAEKICLTSSIKLPRQKKSLKEKLKC